MRRTVVITGATGLLGRAIVEEFATTRLRAASEGEGGDGGEVQDGWTVIAVGHSRAPPAEPARGIEGIRATLGGEGAAELPEALRDAIARADLVVHAAAERRPDVCEREPAGAERLNVDAVRAVGAAAAAAGAGFIHVSTD
jgi:dTDP-4-dehydrorhamnose reductase